MEGWNSDKFAFTNAGKVTEFGRFERQLPGSTVTPNRRVCHVYLYTRIFKFKVEFYATFASDGRAVKALEKAPIEDVFHEGGLAPKWQKYRGISLSFVKLRQVARSESLLNPQQTSPASAGQREATTSLVSPCEIIESAPDNVPSATASKKRKSNLQRLSFVQRRKLINSSTKGSIGRGPQDLQSTDEQSESDMDMSTSLTSD